MAFAFQIYCDFSGYSDIAIGTAKLFGFELLSNFRYPYFSRDIAEFWRRWHISLSSWFRDYLYIPLGGSKQGKLKAVRNTFIIFLVSGFWHGANWTFIVWGGIHACGFLPLLLLNRNRKHTSDVVAYNQKMPSPKEFLQILLTFTFTTFAWIFFRASGIREALGYIKQIVLDAYQHPRELLNISGDLEPFIYIIPFVLADWWLRRDERKLRIIKNAMLRRFTYWLLAVLILLNFNKEASFIYFQF